LFFFRGTDDVCRVPAPVGPTLATGLISVAPDRPYLCEQGP